MDTEWGRIDADGTVFVRTTDGERSIGSWQAGSPDEGLAFYRRRFDDLAADVRLLEGRAKSPAADVKAVRTATIKLKETLPAAAAIGNLAALEGRLDGVLEKLDERNQAQAAERAAAAEAAADRKRALVAEGQKLAGSTQWRPAGDRFRAIVEEWKGIRGVDRKVDSELWGQLSAARRDFDSRRRAHFAQLDADRDAAAEVKRKLVAEATKLSDSTDWGPTARRYRDLMTEWKAAGRAPRETEDELWQAFKTAQDSFFAARGEQFAKRDNELQGNLDAKLALVAEAESLDASADPDGARKRLRSIHDRWEKIGHVPRDQMKVVEDKLGAAERRIRDATAAKRVVTKTESPLVIRLRESVGKLEARLTRAREAGDDRVASETETSLATQREWLAQAEASS